MNKFKHLTILASLILAPIALAQDAVFEELTVTAQKRVSTVMDTAAAIAAISGDDLQERGIRNIGDLDQLSPDLVIGGEGASRKGIRIRGIGTYGFDIGADPSVAVVIDGVAQPRVSTSMHTFEDLERVEILKGPQGAIYGVNALGGIVNLVTKKPSGEQAGKISLKAGNNGDQSLSLMLEGNISNSVSARVSISESQDDGTAFEEMTGRDNGVHFSSVRAAFYGTTDSGIDWSGSFGHSKSNQEAIVMEQKFICNSQNPASHFLPMFSAGTPAAVCSSLAAASSQNTYGVTNLANATVISSYKSEDSQALSTPGYNFSEGMTAALNLSKDYDDFSVTAILGANKVNSGELRDFDATSLPGLNQSHDSSTNTTTLEIRIDSDDSIKYPWSVGLYGARDQGYRSDNFTSFPLSVQNALFGASANATAYNIANGFSTIDGTTGVITNGASALMPTAANYATILAGLNTCVTNANCQAYVTGGGKPAARGAAVIVAQDVANFTASMLGSFENIARVGLKTQSTAIFGNVKIPLMDNLDLFLGGRYSVHDKPYTYEGTTSNDRVPLVVGPYATNAGTTAKEFDPKVTLEYTQGDSLSWLTYSTAYKSGGPAFAKWNAADAEKPYNMEEVEMIEAGYKTSINGGSSQLEITAYQYDYTDNQQLLVCVNALGSPTGCVVTGDATIQGVDLTYRTYLNDSTSLGGTFAFVDATWDRFCDTAAQQATASDPCGIDRKGQTLPFSAENNLSAYIQNVQNLDAGELTLTASVTYKDEYSVTLGKWDGLTTVEDLTKLNLSAELLTQDGWSINAVCTNCTDETYLANGLLGVRAQGGGFRYANAEGRRIGLTLGTEF